MADQNINNMTQTWNSGGTTFSAIKMNVIDTSSAAGSFLASLQVAGTDKFTVGKDGSITVAGDFTLTGDFTISGGVSGIVEAISGVILVPTDKSYTLVLKAPFAGTINETVTKAASGTCTATFKINTTALGGTANSVSSVEETQAQASSNSFAAGDDIVVTISSNSACLDMSFTIKVTRLS